MFRLAICLVFVASVVGQDSTSEPDTTITTAVTSTATRPTTRTSSTSSTTRRTTITTARPSTTAARTTLVSTTASRQQSTSPASKINKDIIDNINNTLLFQCTFDFDTCGFIFDEEQSEIQWARRANKSTGQYTGPEYDHTTGDGFYLFLDAATKFFGRKQGSIARVITPVVTAEDASQPCLNVTFWYHAYGFHLGFLKTRYQTPPFDTTKPLGNWTQFWEIRGQGLSSSWRFVQYQLVDVPAVKIQFEVGLGDGPQGNYAIDDIQIYAAQCPTTTANPNLRGPGGEFLLNTTTPEPPKLAIEIWVIALIVILVVAAIAAAGITTFIIFRQKKLKILQQEQEKEKAERLRREIEQFGMIKARFDRTISGRMAAMGLGPEITAHANQQQHAAGDMQMMQRERTFDRPVVDRRFVSASALPSVTGRPQIAVDIRSEPDEDRADAVFSIVNNSYVGQDDRKRTEAVFDIIGNSNRATTAPATQQNRTKSALARSVHQIETLDPPSVGGTPSSPRLAPITRSPSALRRNSQDLFAEADGGAIAKHPPRSVHFAASPTKESSSSKTSAKAEKIDWFDD